MPQLLQVKSLQKGYRKYPFSGLKTVLRRVDFQLRPGEIAGLYGANGSGKTTFTRLLVGLTNQDDGVVEVLGMKPSHALKKGLIGYVPERERLPGYMTAESMLRVRSRAAQAAPDPSWLDYLFDALNLEAIRDRPARELSKGQRQRISIVLAIATQPALVIMDEPTDGLDPIGRIKVRDIIREMGRRNIGVLMNSHLVDETQSACESYAILFDGEIQERGRSDALRSEVARWQVSFHKDTPGYSEAFQRLDLSSADERGFVTAPADSLASLNDFIRRAQSEGLLLSALEPEQHPIEDKLAEYASRGASQS